MPRPNKSHVVVSRKWHHPKVEAYVNNAELGVQMPIDDFIKAIIEEAGSPAFTLTKSTLSEKLIAASAAVIGELKAHSHKVA